MFTPKAIKISAIIAIVLSCIGLLLSIIGCLYIQGAEIPFFMSCLSWVILTWASTIGYKLSFYKLFPEEYTKVGIRIYGIILAFGLFFFVGYYLGFAISVLLLATLWGLKRNYDTWESSNDTRTN